MKKTMRWLCLLFLLITVVCIRPIAASAAVTKVNKIEITMSEPALGEKPADTVTFPGNTSSEFVKIKWYGEFDSNGGFKANEVYSAKIEFKIQDALTDAIYSNIEPKYMIINGKSCSYGQMGSEIGKDGKTVSISYIYPYYFTESGAKKSIGYLNMAECTFAVPESGQKPATAKQIKMNDGSSLYADKIKWTGTLDSKGRFVAGNEYTAKITLKIRSGETIAVAAHPALYAKYLKVNGNACEKFDWSYSCDQLNLYYTFTAKKTAKDVTEVNNVKLSITEPAAGELPRYDAKVADGWKSYVTHSEWSGNFDTYGRFQAGEEYTFTVTTRVNPTEGNFFYEQAGDQILNNKFVTNKTVRDGGKEITLSYTFPALDSKTVPAPTKTSVDDFQPGDYGVMEMNDSEGVVYFYDSLGTDKELYRTGRKGTTVLVLSAYVKDDYCAVLYDGKLLYVEHSDLFSNHVKYGNGPTEPYGDIWKSSEEVSFGKPISLVGGFLVTANLNKKPVVSDKYNADNTQYYMSDVTWNYEGPMQPYTWAEIVITCKAKAGYYFAHDVKTDYKFIYMPDRVNYIDSDTVQLIHYKWIDGSKTDIGVTDAMKQYIEINTIEHTNWYPYFGTAKFYQPVATDSSNIGSTRFYAYPSAARNVSYSQPNLNTTTPIHILDYDLSDEIPEITGEWCRIALGTTVGFVPKACLTDVVLFDFWEGAPAKLHNSPYKFAGGTGTKDDPFLIATAEQLDAVRKNLKAHYKLIADIDLSEWGNWVPIGDTPAFGAGTDKFNKAQFGGGAFMGSFDGDGHVISGMTIVVNEETPYMQERGNARYYGLFGITGGARITNLGIVNYNIDINYTGVTEDLTMWAGALSGWFNCNNTINSTSADGNLDNCYADGGKISFNVQVAKGSDANISLELGGLVGQASLGKISRCYHGSDITVKCDSPFYMVGAGICATMCNTWITECFNTGTITFPVGDADTFWTSSFVGGIVGEIGPNGIENTMNKPKENGSYIYNCYNAGHLTANTVAGIYVHNNTLSAGYVTSCYNVGKLTCQVFPLDGYSMPRRYDIVSSFTSCCNSKYISKCYSDGNKVSGSVWKKSSKLGRKVLKAIPEDSVVLPKPELKMPFTDVKASADYADAILWAADKKIAPTSAKKFYPNKTCTRSLMITYLWRAAGSPKVKISNPFTDVKKSNTYYYAALWAYSKGLVKGKKFAGSTACTRAEAVYYLWKNAGAPEEYIATNYLDVDTKYLFAVGWALKNSVAAGDSTYSFSAKKKCTRSDVITFIYRAIQ